MPVQSFAMRLQIPVGFGGFHVALLDDTAGCPWLSPTIIQQSDGTLRVRNHSPFVFVYDCGALTEKLACDWARRVGSEIASFFGQIDLAVLSHTDYDHVCAIDALAAHVHIGTLMLPRLTLNFRTAQLASRRSGTPEWYRKFLHNPLEWAASRGVGRVLLVEADKQPPIPDRGEPSAPIDPSPSRNDPSGRPNLQHGRPATEGDGTDRGYSIVSSGDPLFVQAPQQPPSWRLIPMLAAPQDPPGFDKAVIEVLKSVTSAQHLYSGFSGRNVASLRNRLARIYRKHWGSTNHSSLMMLLAPCYSGATAGWLCTGDADLTHNLVQAALVRHGTPWFPAVDTIQVPHHGSPKNLNGAAVSFLRTLAGGKRLKWVASSGKNRWSYPAPSIRNALGTDLTETTASSERRNILRF